MLPSPPAPVCANKYTLTVSCNDRPGIVYEISKILFESSCNVIENKQFADQSRGRFSMRVQFESATKMPVDEAMVRSKLAAISKVTDATWQLRCTDRKPRVLLLVSKLPHCMNDILFRQSIGDLNIEVPAVISNHPDLAWYADNYKVPFHHIPVTSMTKVAAEKQMLELVDELDIDLVVLARYMQVLTPEACESLSGRAINIHHSMLPSFKGARPYHRAHDRGVKLIGATAHYVTSDLDEGPIIEQEVARIDHGFSADDVVALGRNTECLALSRAIRWHTENRVLLDDGRTVVFS